MLNMRITRRGTPGDFLAPIMLNLSKRKAAMAFPALEEMAPLPFTSEVRARTDGIYERMKGVIPAVEWPLFAPEIADILISEERRVGKECGGTCRSRWSSCHSTKKHN